MKGEGILLKYSFLYIKGIGDHIEHHMPITNQL